MEEETQFDLELHANKYFDDNFDKHEYDEQNDGPDHYYNIKEMVSSRVFPSLIFRDLY